MKKFTLVLCAILATLSVSAQEHISFNGATFGQSFNTFIGRLNVLAKEQVTSGFWYSNTHLTYKCMDGRLASYPCTYFIDCSLKNKIVFEITAEIRTSDIYAVSRSFTDVFERKYERCSNENPLGVDFIVANGGTVQKYKIRRKTDGKLIGKIVISTIPRNSYLGFNEGIIWVTYHDYAASKYAEKEYRETMDDIL